MRGESLSVTFEPAKCGARFRAADMSDSSATLVDEVICSEQADGFIIHSHKICREAFKPAIDENIRNSSFFDEAKAFDGPLRGGDEQGIDTARQQTFNLLALQHGILFRRGDHQTVSVPANFSGDCFGHLGKERMKQVRNNEAKCPGSPGNQRARGKIGLIVQLLHALQNALPGVVRNIGVASEHLGYGDGR